MQNLNMDFKQRIVIDTRAADWVASPMPGVWRKPLAREEAERGHATSIVRYEAGARFSAHDHPLGEEILVLDGTFSDETGDYHAGTYFRNPEGFRHAPFSEPGCVILVKLHQLQVEDRAHVVIDTHASAWSDGGEGLQFMLLHSFGTEKVALVKLAAGQTYEAHIHEGGEEVYVIEGEYSDEQGSYPAGSWIRSPIGSRHQPRAVENTLLWVKTGHLA